MLGQEVSRVPWKRALVHSRNLITLVRLVVEVSDLFWRCLLFSSQVAIDSPLPLDFLSSLWFRV